MAAVALLKFSQGLTIGADGQALKGEIGTAVSVENSSNVDVASWQIDLVYSDPASSVLPAIPYAFSDNSSVPLAIFTPDVTGCYRFVLKVWTIPNRAGAPADTDIRMFTVPEPFGLVAPPAQLWPIPLPVPQSGQPGNKPNEFNYGGQPDGWAGNGADDGLLNDLIRRVDKGLGPPARQEVIPVSIDGQTSFTLSQPTTSDSTVEMWVNGVKQAYGVDYSVVGAAVTYTGATSILTTDVLEFWYVISVIHATNSTRQETLPVTINGQTAFTLGLPTASNGTVEMFLNSGKMQYGVDYTVNGAAVTYSGAIPLQTTDIVEFWYIIGPLNGINQPAQSPVLVISVKTGNYLLTPTDYLVPVDSTGGPFSLTLPTGMVVGTRFEVADVGGACGTNVVTVNAPGGEQIIGGGTFNMASNYVAYTFTKTTANFWSVS